MPCDARKAQGDYGPVRVAQLAERGLVVDIPVWVGPMCSTATKADGGRGRGTMEGQELQECF